MMWAKAWAAAPFSAISVPMQRHLRADADAGHHEADLVDDAVGEDAPHVVFQQRIDDAVEHHPQPGEDQQLLAREATQQGEDGGLGGEGREEDHAARRGLGIGVGQPGGERRRGGVDEKPGEDQPGAGVLQLDGAEGDRAGFQHVGDDARHQQDAAEQVHEHVAKPGTVGAALGRAPEHQGRGQRHDLPEHEQGDEVAGETAADRAAGIDERGRKLQHPRLAHGVESAGEGHQCEHGREQAAQRVAAQRLQLVPEEGKRQHRAIRHLPDQGEAEQWQQQRHWTRDALRQQRQEQAAQDEHQSGRQRPEWRQARHRPASSSS
jgi:hypothetical protein